MIRLYQMKKYLYTLLLPAFILACNSASRTDDTDRKKIVTVTIEPQRFFLDHIVEGAFIINTLVPPGTSPETYEPAPSVMMDMGKSDLYFKVGDLGFEKAWTARLVKNNPNMIIVDCSAGIQLMDGNAHAHSDNDGLDHSHGGMDPHVWSSPQAVRRFTKNMLDAVVSADPDKKSFYNANFDSLTAKINATDSIIRGVLRDASSKSFIIYHPALGYFARDYGLHQYSIEFEGKAPSPSQMKNLVDVARKENINTVFIQRGFDAKNAEVIAKEIGAEVFEVDPLKYEWDAELVRIASILARGTDE